MPLSTRKIGNPITVLVAGLVVTMVAPVGFSRTSNLVAVGGGAPNEFGSGDGFFSDLGLPVLNNLSQVGFAGDISGSSSAIGVFRTSEAGTQYIARQGDPFGPPTLVLGDDIADDRVVINNAGQVAFVARITGAGFDSGIFRGDGAGFERIVSESDPAPMNDGGATSGAIADLFTGVTPQSVRINDAGQVIFYEDDIALTLINDQAFFRYGDVKGLIDLSREGDDINEGAGIGWHHIAEIGSNPTFHFNNHGQVAFYAQDIQPDPIEPGPPIPGEVLFKSDENDGGSFRAGRPIAAEKDTIDPGGFVMHIFFSTLAFNDAGQLGFMADGDAGGNGLDRLFVMDRPHKSVPDPTPFSVLVEDTFLPDGTGIFSISTTTDRRMAINAAGQFMVNIGLAASAGSSATNGSIVRIESGLDPFTMTQLGDTVPGGDGEIQSYATASINAHGVIAYEANIRNNAGGTDTDRGVYISDGEETVQAVRKGQPVGDFSTLTDFQAHLGSGGQDGMQNGFNDFGQFTYLGTVDGFLPSIYLFTPEVNWRRNTSGNWDDNDNWTLSLPPGNPHDVTIAPAASLTVNGPTDDVTVQSLMLGGGAGNATLNLANGGVITPTTPLQILDHGILTGDGTIDGDVDNFGTVLADNVNVTGTLTNHETITGDGFVNGSVVNATGGTIEVIGNDLGFDGTVTNQSGGLISARNAILRFEGVGLINQGIAAMSFGTSDVFGDVENQPTGRIIVSGNSNATFWNDVENNGNIQVSDGSTAVFFGDVTGSGSFPGTGTVFFEGGVFPGSSPGSLDFNSDVTLGPAASLVLELAGLIPSTEHDQINTTRNLHAAGALTIELLDGYAPRLGDRFNLLDFSSISGSFGTINLPALGHGLAFDTSTLLTTGAITVVPEPGTGVGLMFLAATGLCGCGRRKR